MEFALGNIAQGESIPDLAVKHEFETVTPSRRKEARLTLPRLANLVPFTVAERTVGQGTAHIARGGYPRPLVLCGDARKGGQLYAALVAKSRRIAYTLQQEVRALDCEKIGRLLRSLRLEKGLTQKQLAERLNLSDRTVSKWERGLGCPDISLLGALSDLLGVHMEKLLLGDLQPKSADGGNMKRLCFYVCPSCGNILTATSGAEISCCGRRLEALHPKPADEGHRLSVAPVEDELLVTFSHEMRKEHFIRFVACLSWDRLVLVRLYPEQDGQVRFPQMRKGGKFFFCCSQDGLFVNP